MPNTKTRRKPRGSADVSYNVMFPGGRKQDLGSNQKARVYRGDRAVNETVAADFNSMYKNTRRKAKVVPDGTGGTKVVIHRD